MNIPAPPTGAPLPPYTWIVSKRYSIRTDPRLPSHPGHLGECDSAAATITIDSSAPLQVQWETLYHEIGEAAKVELELKIRHRKLTALMSVVFQATRSMGLIPRLAQPEQEGNE